MRVHPLVTFTLIAFFVAFASSALAVASSVGVSERTPVDDLPSDKELPDPFRFADGRPVSSPSDWPARRREILSLFQTYEYGQVPPSVPTVWTEDPDYNPPARSGSNAGKPPEKDPTPPSYLPGTSVTKYRVTAGPSSGKSVSFHAVVTKPPGQGPFPVIIRGDLCWGPVRTPIGEEIVRRGYMLVDFDRTEIAPDDKKSDRTGAGYALFPGVTTSALSMWAWGYHRVIDGLLQRKDVDLTRVAITGHSRGGKTTLLAGATDERIALTVPNDSGCGGAGCFRYQAPDSEDLPRITKNFPHWFHPQFAQFTGKIDRIPVDQHLLKAAVAPRSLLECEALGDAWANPEGSQVTFAAAREVYAWLGVPDQIAIHFRQGIHEQNLDDWQTLLDFADHVFHGKPSSRKFNDLAFPNAPKPWSWATPANRPKGS